MSDRERHWQKIYGQKSAISLSWYQESPTLSLELIAHAGIRAEHAIIDVGGGASTLVDHLQGAGFRNLSVLDISENALASSRKRVGESADEISWIEADITEFSPPHPYRLWHDRAVFHFLTAARDRKKYVEVLRRSLPSGASLVIAAFAIGGPEMCSGLPVVQYDAKKISLELGGEFELLEKRQEAHTTPARKQQLFNYFRFVRRTL